MKFLSLDEVLAIHERMIVLGGGRAGVLDFTLLHSAVERPRARFGGKYLYPSIWEKAAALLQSLVKNHPFEDGNKRTAFFSTMRFLQKNRLEMKAEKRAIVAFMVSVDVKERTVAEIVSWIKQHTRAI